MSPLLYSPSIKYNPQNKMPHFGILLLLTSAFISTTDTYLWFLSYSGYRFFYFTQVRFIGFVHPFSPLVIDVRVSLIH
jgi:hypothetical protein